MFKKSFSVILALVILVMSAIPAFAIEKEENFGAYKRVVIIGVDGAGSFFNIADTPCFHDIFADGAVKYYSKTESYTSSAPNWGSILNGVAYSEHELKNEDLGVERSSDGEYPTIFTYVRKAMPNAVLASFVNWSPINYGLIEKDINVEKHDYPEDDARVADEICKYFDAGNDPTLFFVQFDSVDHAGHEYGCMAPNYFKQISIVDSYIGRVHDALERNNLLDDTLFLVVCDHGERITGGHGSNQLSEENVVVAADGKGVINGGCFDKETRNRDIPAIALYALGIDAPENMTSRVPDGIFTESTPDLCDNFYTFLFKVLSAFSRLYLRIESLASNNYVIA